MQLLPKTNKITTITLMIDCRFFIAAKTLDAYALTDV